MAAGTSGPFRFTDRAARDREEEELAPAAMRAVHSRGRAQPEADDRLRTAFERDRDRILHAKAFRRLALGLNETLAEAIALAHDVGHSPFGHLGEDALEPYVLGGWHHAAQGVRIVEVLEQLNLTWEVRDGVRSHSWKIDPPPSTREGECVRYADRIGYLSHDALDAIRAGVLRPDDLPARARAVFGEPGSEMVGTMIDAVVEGSLSPQNTAGAVVMAPEPLEAMHELRAFMFERVYASETAAGKKHVAIDVIRRLVDHHLAHPELIPATYRDNAADEVTQVVDYVSGMTDRFALSTHDRLFDADASSRMTPLLRGR
jgi:dGTPase